MLTFNFINYLLDGLLLICSRTFVKIGQLKIEIGKPVVRREQKKKNDLLDHYWKLLDDHQKRVDEQNGTGERNGIDELTFLDLCANLVGKRTNEYLESK